MVIEFLPFQLLELKIFQSPRDTLEGSQGHLQFQKLV